MYVVIINVVLENLVRLAPVIVELVNRVAIICVLEVKLVHHVQLIVGCARIVATEFATKEKII